MLWLAWKPNVTRRVLEALPSVRLAIRWGVGFEQMDVDAATELGVAIANAPAYGTDDVAETAMALLLTVARRTAFHHERMLQGEWPASDPGQRPSAARSHPGAHRHGAHRLRGRRASRPGSGCGSSATTSSGHPPSWPRRASRRWTWTRCWRARTIVSLHVPYTPGTHHLVDAALLAKLKPGAILVNTARGKVVDTDALIDALQSGHLAGAGLDVFEQEPLPADSPLRSAPNVVMTPHVAGFSVEAFVDLRREMCQTTIDFMTTGWASTIVNPAVRDRMRPVRP